MQCPPPPSIRSQKWLETTFIKFIQKFPLIPNNKNNNKVTSKIPMTHVLAVEKKAISTFHLVYKSWSKISFWQKLLVTKKLEVITIAYCVLLITERHWTLFFLIGSFNWFTVIHLFFRDRFPPKTEIIGPRPLVNNSIQ